MYLPILTIANRTVVERIIEVIIVVVISFRLIVMCLKVYEALVQLLEGECCSLSASPYCTFHCAYALCLYSAPMPCA